MKTTRNVLYIVLASLSLACFTLSPTAQAVSPPPDGGYPNNNTAEGDDALFSLTRGIRNTALGFDALFHNTTGNNNTAVGFEALYGNNADNNTAIGFEALVSNTTGNGNAANGFEALFSNTTGSSNTAQRCCCALFQHNRQQQHGHW